MTIFTDPAILRNEISTKLVNEDFLTEVDFLLQALNIVDSVMPIVQNANIQFKENIYLSENVNLQLDTGVKFPNSSTPEVIQTVPYLGSNTVEHDNLTNLDSPNAHDNLLSNSGDFMTGNLGLNDAWINSQGVNNYGISFKRYTSQKENVLFASNTSLVFDSDQSKLTSVAGSANAWISFDSTTNPITVNTSFNVSSIEKISKGKFKIVFNENLEGDYIAITTSNGHETDSEVNMVNAACCIRESDHCTFVVQDKKNQYTNTKHNDLVILSIR